MNSHLLFGLESETECDDIGCIDIDIGYYFAL